MNKAIKEYEEAVKENILASQSETLAKAQKIKAHYRLIRAKDGLRMAERDLLDDVESNFERV